MFRIVILTAITLVLGAGLYITYTDPNSLPSQLQPYAPTIRTALTTGLQGANTALSKSRQAEPAVMGVKTESSRIFQEDTQGKPVHQKAMEFTQYQYCKLIIDTYESEQSKQSTSTSSDKPREN
jgi:hypothetical protein